MKIKVFGGIAVLAIVTIATFNLSVGNNHSSSLSLMNVEALANGENKNCVPDRYIVATKDGACCNQNDVGIRLL